MVTRHGPAVLAFAVGGFVAAAMISATSAPVAHADDFSTILADITATAAHRRAGLHVLTPVRANILVLSARPPGWGL